MSVLSSRGVARPDWHVKFCQIIYEKEGSSDIEIERGREGVSERERV